MLDKQKLHLQHTNAKSKFGFKTINYTMLVLTNSSVYCYRKSIFSRKNVYFIISKSTCMHAKLKKYIYTKTNCWCKYHETELLHDSILHLFHFFKTGKIQMSDCIFIWSFFPASLIKHCKQLRIIFGLIYLHLRTNYQWNGKKILFILKNTCYYPFIPTQYK